MRNMYCCTLKMLVSTFGKTFALRSTIISRISSSLYIGGYAGVWKEHKSDATVYDAVENKTSAKFKPRSLNTPMNFKQWKMHGPRLYEKRLRFLMKAGNVSFQPEVSWRPCFLL